MKSTIIVAMDMERGIGINNELPWSLPEDLAHFKRWTMGYPILMGRKTFESIGRPLPGRRNIVISSGPALRVRDVETADSLEAALALVGGMAAYVIGGASIYKQAIDLVDSLIVTEVGGVFDCDTFFPKIDLDVWLEIFRTPHVSTTGIPYSFVAYKRRLDRNI